MFNPNGSSCIAAGVNPVESTRLATGVAMVTVIVIPRSLRTV